MDRGVGAVIHATQPVQWVPGIEWRNDWRGGVVEHVVTMFHDRDRGIIGLCGVTGILYSVIGRFTIPADTRGDHVRYRMLPWSYAGIPDATVTLHWGIRLFYTMVISLLVFTNNRTCSQQFSSKSVTTIFRVNAF